MTLQNQEILNKALGTLQENFYPMLKPSQKELTQNGPFDAIVKILSVDFLCEIKNNITKANLNLVIEHILEQTENETTPILLVTRYINPPLFNELVNNNINILDCAGNCHIRHEKEGRMIFQLSNKGEKNPFMKEKNYPIFQEAGIRVIFYFLQDDKNAARSYRDIQDITGVSLGTIKNVVNDLIERDYILVTKEGRFLKNKRKLLDQWVENYNQVLKPKLFLSRMTFRSDEQRKQWLTMVLPDGMYWGGESAAYMIDAYLNPGNFDIYTDTPSINLIKTGFVVPDDNGEIGIYQKFWNWETENQLAPLVLIYADLMGSGNSRCLEMARRLLENGLNNFK